VHFLVCLILLQEDRAALDFLYREVRVALVLSKDCQVARECQEDLVLLKDFLGALCLPEGRCRPEAQVDLLMSMDFLEDQMFRGGLGDLEDQEPSTECQ
jgi:hypothetical protein